MSALARFLEPALALIITATMFGSCVAHAQVVQPTYVRPSKGAPIVLFNRVKADGATLAYSPVLDFSAFASVQMRVDNYDAVGNAKAFGACQWIPTVRMTGSMVKTGPFVFESTPYAFFSSYSFAPLVTSATYSINAVSYYGRFELNSILGVGLDPNCYYTVTATPLPYQQSVPVTGAITDTSQIKSASSEIAPVIIGGTYDDGSGARIVKSITSSIDGSMAVTNAPYNKFYTFDLPFTNYSSPLVLTVGNTAVRVCDTTLDGGGTDYPNGSTNTFRHFIELQNVGAAPIMCKIGPTSTPPTITTSNFQFALKGGSALADGLGGSIRLPSLSTDFSIYCIRSTGVSSYATCMMGL